MPLSLVDIRNLRSRDLEPLLAEETADWRRKLDWDFSKSAALIRKFADEKRLSGAALLDKDQAAGYGYAGLDNDTGLIAGLYVSPAWRKVGPETLLFRVLMDALMQNPRVGRVESQLMLMAPASAEAISKDPGLRLFPRILMTMDLPAPLPPGQASSKQQFRIAPWSDEFYESASRVVAFSYDGHPDSQLNDHYRTPEQASRFLRGVVNFPGSCTFCQSASYIAFDATTGQAEGIVLSGFVAGHVGHIAELCVTPRVRGAGLGYELLRRAAKALSDAGATRISLSVTATNREAVSIYTRCGFREFHRFSASVWEKRC